MKKRRRLARSLRWVANRLDPVSPPYVVTDYEVAVNGDEIIKAIRAAKRRRGEAA